MKRNLKKLIVSNICILILLAGCGVREEVPDVVIKQEKEQISYNYATVLRDNVELTQRITCTYTQTSAQEVSFVNSGKLVDKVYVREGDTVKKGDILVELSYESLESDIERLEYNIKRNELLLSYIDANENLDIQSRWLSANSGSVSYIEESVKQLKANNDKQRQSYNDSLEFDRMELAAKKKELKNSRIYATIDGKVYNVKRGLSGSTSKAGEVIMTIVDNSEGLFVAETPEYKDMFREDETYSVNITYGVLSGVFEIVPYEMDKWDDKQTFAILSGPDNVSLEVGVFGSLMLKVDRRENVLCLPTTAVYNAEGKSYVYVVGEDNMREVKWIETGLKGDTLVEVVSGLSEGDKVVKK